MKYLLILFSFMFFKVAPIQTASSQSFSLKCETFEKVLSDSVISDYLGLVKNYYEVVDSIIVIDMDSVLERKCRPRNVNGKTVRYYFDFLPRMVKVLNDRAHRELKGKRTIVLHVWSVPQRESSQTNRKYTIWQLNTNAFVEIEQTSEGGFELIGRGVY